MSTPTIIPVICGACGHRVKLRVPTTEPTEAHRCDTVRIVVSGSYIQSTHTVVGEPPSGSFTVTVVP